MTTLPQLIDTNGRTIQLDRQLGSGGEGAVFTLRNNTSLVAKVYHSFPNAQTVEKLTAMERLANPRLLGLAAWPQGLLYEARTRQLIGFLMPRLSDCQPIQHLYNPVRRLRCFPRAGWNFQVRAAANLAAAFDEVHKVGCLIGDVNENNVQVSTQALVWLIDCDSFQVRMNGKVYGCEVGVPHYIPPELQGKSLRGLIRTENHDGFGLAVLIYQLLFVGRHPYAGVYHGPGDPSFEQLIAEFRFAQGPAARSWDMAPPPHTPTFADIPPELGTLFRRAFERGSEAGTRPKPLEWLTALQRLERSLVECSADPGHKYWRGSQSCVWCRLAEKGGPEYYFGVAGDVGTFVVNDTKLKEVLQRLEASGPFDFPYDRRQFAPSRLPNPKPLPEGLEESRSTAIVLGAMVAICMLALPLGLIHRAICIFAFLSALVFGIWLAIYICVSPWHREYRRRRAILNQARNNLNEIEEEWRQVVRRYHQAHSESSESIQRLVSVCRGLASEYQIEMQRHVADAEVLARIRHLRLHLIADAPIPQIGAGRKQVLASYGIFTAADIEYDRIRGIKGFGDVLTNNLLAWKAEVLRQFRFDPATAISPSDHRMIRVKFQNKQQKFLVELDQQISHLESLETTCRNALQKLIPELRRTVAQYEKAGADLNLLTRNR